jgi:PST family polysaccharide transporter
VKQTNFGKVALHGTFWTYAAYYCGKLFVFASVVVLTRLLSKEDFGLAAYAIVAIGFIDVLSELGVGTALTYYKDEPDAVHTAFWLGFLASFALFALTWFIAPLIGSFFKEPRAIPLTRMLAFSFPINAVSFIHERLLYKRLEFRRKFLPDVARSAGKGIVSITLAAWGFGAWSLVIGQLAGNAVSSVLYLVVFRWRPAFHFASRMAKLLLSYGISILSNVTLSQILLNVDYLFVGRFLGPVQLGIYTVAFRIPELLILQFCSQFGTVIFPVYVKMREDNHELKEGFLSTLRYLSMITIPIGIGLALVARPLALTAFTARWQEVVPVMRAISIYALLLSLTHNAGAIYKALGKPGMLTKLAIFRAAILVPSLWWAVTVPKSIVAVGWVHVIAVFIATIVNLIVASRVIRLRVSEILATVYPALLGGLSMIPPVLLVLRLMNNSTSAVQLFISAMVGGVTYLGSLWVLQREMLVTAGKTLRVALLRGQV